MLKAWTTTTTAVPVKAETETTLAEVIPFMKLQKLSFCCCYKTVLEKTTATTTVAVEAERETTLAGVASK